MKYFLRPTVCIQVCPFSLHVVSFVGITYLLPQKEQPLCHPTVERALKSHGPGGTAHEKLVVGWDKETKISYLYTLKMSTSQMQKVSACRRRGIINLRPALYPSVSNCKPKRNDWPQMMPGVAHTASSCWRGASRGACALCLMCYTPQEISTER